ncbi:MAG: Gfo/Idh/MocA family oxidoreductase [Chloroflexi bacterium]|nr:Gfo/Idh/MocA family oxidoreductase [Chloroflexota bacterium]
MTIRIGMVGAGRMANAHAACLTDVPDAKIVAVADVLPNLAHTLASKWGAAEYADYCAMLDAEQLDAVYICTPTGSHADIAIEVAQRGLPFFIEKPLTLTMRDAWRVRCAVEQSNVMTCVCYQWRYTQATLKAREILGARPLALTSAEWLWTLPPVLWLRDKDLGGGQVVDQTTHLTDLCQWFGGDVTDVYAAYTLNTYTDAEFHNWDGYSLTFKHASGAAGSLRCTYALFKEIAEFQPPRVDLIARELFLRVTQDDLTVVTPRGREQFANKGALHLGVNRAFVSAVQNRDASLIHSSIPETFRSLALTLAANESAETGRIIHLDDFMQAAR